MAQLNDLLVLGSSNLIGETNVNKTLTVEGVSYLKNNISLSRTDTPNNPFIHFVGSSGSAYVQLSGTSMAIGNGWANSLQIDSSGNAAVPGSLLVAGSKVNISSSSINSKVDIILPNDKGIIQHQNSGSNYTVPIKWLQGGVSEATYDPQIGHHNTGDTDGAMILLPYSTNTSPWSGSDGLYIGKNTLKWNGKTILHSSNYNSYALPLSGGTMTGDITLNNSTVNIVRAGISQSWYQGRNSAMIKTTSYSGYDAILSMKTTAGDWALGVYNDNKLYFTYILDSNYNSNSNTTTAQIRFDPDGNVAAPKFTGALAGNATSATKLATARTIRTNLASTSTASFNGTANITPGVTGTLPVGNGGTGRTVYPTTDYTGNQYRASKIQDTIPTSVDNGCLVYVYVDTTTI